MLHGITDGEASARTRQKSAASEIKEPREETKYHFSNKNLSQLLVYVVVPGNSFLAFLKGFGQKSERDASADQLQQTLSLAPSTITCSSGLQSFRALKNSLNQYPPFKRFLIRWY